MHVGDVLVDTAKLVLHQAFVPLASLLVLFQIKVLLKGVQFLVELSSNLDLGGLEVKFVGLIHLDVGVVAVTGLHDLFDERGLSPSNHVVKENPAVVLVRLLERRHHVSLDELARALELLQEELSWRDLQIKDVDQLMLQVFDVLSDLQA